MKVKECDVEPPAAGRPMKLPNDVIVGRNQIQRWRDESVFATFVGSGSRPPSG